MYKLSKCGIDGLTVFIEITYNKDKLLSCLIKNALGEGGNSR